MKCLRSKIGHGAAQGPPLRGRKNSVVLSFLRNSTLSAIPKKKILALSTASLEGRLEWDGRYLGEVDIPEDLMTGIVAEGLELVSVKNQIADLEKSREALEARIGASLAPVRAHLEGQPTSP